MAYSRTWDNNYPPDTQQASLLGQDIRNLKGDIQERLLLSGTLANRPTPEPGFVGIIYLCTDTQQIFSWDGSSWNEIRVFASSGIIAYRYGPIQNTGSTTENTIFQVSLPAGVGFKNGFVRTRFNVRYNNTLSNSVLFSYYLGSQRITGIGTNVSLPVTSVEFMTAMTGSMTGQASVITYTGATSGTANNVYFSDTPVASAVDTSVAQVLKVTAKNTSSADVIVTQNFMVDRFAQ